MIEQYVGFPDVIQVYGNFITDRHGYFESLHDIESKQCTIEHLDGGQFFDGWNIYGFQMLKDIDIRNWFTFDMQYCSYDGEDNLFVCDQLNVGDYVKDVVYTPIPGVTDLFNVKLYDSGYAFALNHGYYDENGEYISYLNEEGVNNYESHVLILLDGNQGVPILDGANTVNYSFDFKTHQPFLEFLIKFVFMDKDHRVIHISDAQAVEATPGLQVVRQQVIRSIPPGAKYVAPEFQIPEGMAGDEFFYLAKNCLLFDNNFIGFVRNPEEPKLLEETFYLEELTIPLKQEGEYTTLDVQLAGFTSTEELVRLEVSYIVHVDGTDTLRTDKVCFVRNNAELTNVAIKDTLYYDEVGNSTVIDELCNYYGFINDIKVNNLNEYKLRFGFITGDNASNSYIRDIYVKAYYPDMEVRD